MSQQSPAASSLLSFGDESYSVPITTGEYGQTGRGSLAEGLLKRRLGDDAVKSESSHLSVASQTIRVELPPTEPGRLRLLGGVSASFEPGTLTALMGSFGAGGHIMGDISINGKPKTDAMWKSVAGYCEQVDLHNPALTVRESLIFAARLRLQPFDMSDEAKVPYATHLLSLLDIEEFADMLVELSANPAVLFADEPTSGLDSLSASVVVASLEKAAKQEGLTIVCTIHQPSRSVFEAFDNLLLLRKGGVCVYNGPIKGLQAHMTSAPNGEKYLVPEGANPADHTLDVFCGPGGIDVDWSELYEKSDMAVKVNEDHDVVAATRGAIAVSTIPQSFLAELFIEIQRELFVMWRTPTSSSGAPQNVVGSIFFFNNIATVPLLSSMIPLIKSRAVFYRELASGTYRRAVYGIAVQVAEIPFNLGAALLSFILIYFMVGLNMEGERVIYFFLMALVSYWFLPAFGQLLAFVSPNTGVAVAFGSLVMTLFTLAMGFLM
ncbi:transporter G family member [Seminavis robusta]|uniref:Transporter G family member n=1 Tax=Seminavis robusta TaxID=568900 RepID=A0A9N8HNG7_9STRA|nr:transporter G family member [Seminavis robusta]|eukprot:Sro1083_g239320.1 transporter G family member (493) ;mRNA; f:8547-10443